MYRLACAEVWGGIKNQDLEVCSSAVRASLYSSACDGGKGGDIYYLSVCESDLLTRIAVADVVGHGESVSLVSQWVYDALRAQMNSADCRGVLTALNRRVTERGLEALTTAAVIGVYRADGNAYFAYAGHHPVLISRQGAAWDPVEQRADDKSLSQLPLGVDAGGTYTQDVFPIARGDRMVVYTDGVLEAPNADGELFGAERLLEVLGGAGTRSLSEVKTLVLDAVRDHTGGSLDHDDVTLMAIEVL